jgi:hypothetical protein
LKRREYTFGHLFPHDDHCDEFHELDQFVDGSWIWALKSIMMLVVPERIGLMTLASISDLHTTFHDDDDDDDDDVC